MSYSVRRLIDRLAKLLTETDTTLAEFWGSTLLVSTGAWLVIPFTPDTFEAIGAYRLLRGIAPEWGWGLAFIGLGALTAISNVLRNRDGRRACAFISSGLFGFLALLAFLALRPTLLVPSCATAAFVEGLIFWHLREPPGGADDADHAA